MAIRDSSYEGSFSIPTPKGVYQAAGDTNVNINYAYRAQNMRTERGLLATAYGTKRAFPSVGAPVGTLARFYRRTRPDDPEVYVAAAGGGLYTYTMGTAGWVLRMGGLSSDTWSYVTYEAAVDGQTVDVMILSNAQDGMVAIYGSDLHAQKKPLAIGDDFADVKFAVLSRHAERIWGTGAPGYPDSIFYSKPYNPFDWTADTDTPQLGGGVIMQPSWDGDAFLALIPFGGYLLAAKRSTVYEIRGTDPSTYTIQSAYGTDGPVQARTICADGMSVLYLSGGGMGLYDGSEVKLLARDALAETMRMQMRGMQGTATACICEHIYYLALCVMEQEGDVVTENNCVIEFDIARGTFMLRSGLRVKDFYALDGKVYFSQADAPYDIWRYNDPDSATMLDAPIQSLWETPWLDLGKAYVKRDFVLRFTADADGDGVPLVIELETERRTRQKAVMLSRRRTDYRVKLQSAGTRVKLRIGSTERPAGWRIYGGIQVEYSIDEQ